MIRGRQRACPEHMRQREARKPKRIRGRALQERNAGLAWQNPLCVECEKNGRTRPATEWDHIIPLEQGGRDDETNLQGLCDDCHATKTAEERRRRA